MAASKKKKKTTVKKPVAPVPVEPEVFGDSAADSVRLAEAERDTRIEKESASIVATFLTTVKKRRGQGRNATKAIPTSKSNLKASLHAARRELRKLGYKVKNASWIAENNWYTKISWPTPKSTCEERTNTYAIAGGVGLIVSSILLGTTITVILTVAGLGYWIFVRK